MSMERRKFLKLAVSAGAAGLVSGCQMAGLGTNRGRTARKPNIVLFYVDDLGWSDVGYNGSGYYRTPHIDKLAAEGMVFTAAYANAPICAPTRACLHSGQYAPRHGVYTMWKSDRKPRNKRKLIPTPNTEHLSPDNVTLMEALDAAGYVGASMGKWHLGVDPKGGPLGQGFHINIGGNTAGTPPGGHFSPYKNKDMTDGPEGEYLTDRLTGEALSFMDENRHRPFFLYLSHYAVHEPIQAKEGLIDTYKDAEPVGGRKDPVYAAMIDSVDLSLGRVMKKLDELGLAKDTMVVFSSDNGGHGCITSNSPLRGAKGMLYEGEIRVPLAVRQPSRIEAGSRCDEPVLSIDFYPTFLEVAGARKPRGKILDGKSLVPLLEQSGALNRQAIYWHFPAYLQRYGCMDNIWRTTPVGAIRKGDWKLLEFFEPKGQPNRLELYNLKEDIGETRNRRGDAPEKTRELLEDMRQWRRRLNAPVPEEPNPYYDPEAEPDGFNWT